MNLKLFTHLATNMRTTLDRSGANYIQHRLPGLDIVLSRKESEYTLTFWRRDQHVNNEEAETIAEAFKVPMGTEPTLFEPKDMGSPAFAHRYAWTERQAVAA